MSKFFILFFAINYHVFSCDQYEKNKWRGEDPYYSSIYGYSGRNLNKTRSSTVQKIKKEEIKKEEPKKEKYYNILFNHVTETIKKQDEAVDKICNAICSYKAFLNEKYFQNPRILIYGPSGCGKTAIAELISKKIDIPFFSIDASSLVGSGYHGITLLEKIAQIIIECKNKNKKNNEMIIFFDEIDKLMMQTMKQDSTPGSVLSELLVFVEKGLSELNFSTERILIFFAGAFHQINIIEARKTFREFFGRVTNSISIKELKRKDFIDIFTTSKDSPFVKSTEEFKNQKRNFEVKKDAIEYIAHYVEKCGTGARGVKSAMHDLLQPYYGKKEDEKNIVITLDDCKKLFEEFMNDQSDNPPPGMYR